MSSYGRPGAPLGPKDNSHCLVNINFICCVSQTYQTEEVGRNIFPPLFSYSPSNLDLYCVSPALVEVTIAHCCFVLFCFFTHTAPINSALVFSQHFAAQSAKTDALRLQPIVGHRCSNSNAGKTGAASTPPTSSLTDVRCSCNKQVKCHSRWRMWNTPRKVNRDILSAV